MDSMSEKKGLHWLAWVGIGCGVLVVIGVVIFGALGWFAVQKGKELAADFEANPAKVAAEFMVRANPDLELVESNDDAGTITVRVKSSGETVTMNYDDIKDGKFSIETDKGKVTMDAQDTASGPGMTVETDEGTAHFGASASLDGVPDWVVIHPDAVVQGSMTTSGKQGVGGTVTFSIDAGYDAVVEYYQTELADLGYEIQHQSMSFNDSKSTTLSGKIEGEKRTQVVTVALNEGKVQVVVVYGAAAE